MRLLLQTLEVIVSPWIILQDLDDKEVYSIVYVRWGK